MLLLNVSYVFRVINLITKNNRDIKATTGLFLIILSLTYLVAGIHFLVLSELPELTPPQGLRTFATCLLFQRLVAHGN